MRLLFYVGLIFSVMLINSTKGFSADLENSDIVAVKEFEGEVINVDVSKSILNIKTVDQDGKPPQDIEVYTNSSTTIEKDYSPIDLSQINIGDQVNISYMTDESGKNMAMEIIVGKK